MSRGRRTAALLAAGLATGLTAGCGASTLSASQLRSRAAQACQLAGRRMAAIATPTAPAQEAAFLRRGIAALAPEVSTLQRLRAPGDMAGDYRDAVSATGTELAALRSTLRGLGAGNDPVVAIKTLQQQLAAAELRAGRAWTTLELPACRSD